MDNIIRGHYCPVVGIRPSDMGSRGMVKFVVLGALVLLVAGAVVLATWDMPAPTTTIEKVIPNERFNK